MALSTLSFSSLTPATTYYFKVGSINWDNVRNYANVISTVTLNTPTPVGLAGTAVGVSSISWAWGGITGASAYTLYMATSPSTAVYTGLANSFIEMNLSTNTAYGRVVSATVNGVMSPLSAAVTTYTLAATPGQPQFSNVFYTSFTVTWATNGNPGYTPYEVSESTDITFATDVSTPIAFTDGFLTNTTTFVSLTPSTTYYIRVRAQNGDLFASAFSASGSTRTLNVPVPQNLIGTALGVSSISWTWSSVTGASSYNVYEATSTSTLVGTSGTNSFFDINLSTNIAYGRVVTAIVGGVESGLSASATTYTLARQRLDSRRSRMFLTPPSP